MSDDNWWLRTCLQASVPLCIADLDAMDERRRGIALRNWTAAAEETLAYRGDLVLGGYDFTLRARRGARAEIAHAFAEAARGVAVLSLNHGGVEFVERVWCAKHSPGGAIGSYPCSPCVEAEAA